MASETPTAVASTESLHHALHLPHLPLTHDRAHADFSFPSQATDTRRAGVTDEYRQVTAAGLVSVIDALQPSPKQNAATPSFMSDKEAAHKLDDVKLVTWEDHDPENPRNWSNAYRWYITTVAALAVVSVAFGSAVVTGDFPAIQSSLQTSEIAVAASVSLMVVGFGLGPLAWSPLSELYGRRPLWIVPSLVYVLLNIPCALAPDISTLLACRFLSGLFAAAPLTLAGGTIADVWDTSERGLAIALFAAAPYGGPVLGPIVGGFVGEGLGWRWMLWVNMIFAGAVTLLVCTLPETYAPVLLRRRAERLRKETGDAAIATEQELFWNGLDAMLVETLVRPWQMLATEPILLLMSLFIALIYGLLYAFFFSFPAVFGPPAAGAASDSAYNLSPGLTGLTFLSVIIGLLGALLVTPRLERDFARRTAARGGTSRPEDRLVGMMLGAPFVPLSLLIFGWTSPPVVAPGGWHWVGPCSAGIPFGFGMVIIYFSANAYLIDSFHAHPASALAAKTLVRSGAGAAMPLFITQMYHALEPRWAASVLALVSLAMVPIPFLFWRYGERIRARSAKAA